MRSVNKVIIIGNITRDPSVRETPSGQRVATFGIATNRQWKTRGGDMRDSAEFHEIVTWSRLSELAEKHLSKGKLVYIEGYLSTRSWETPEGVKRFKTEIVAQDIIILNRKDDSSDEFTHEEKKATKEIAPKVSEEKAVTEEIIPETVEEEIVEEEIPKSPEEISEKSNIDESIIDRDLGL